VKIVACGSGRETVNTLLGALLRLALVCGLLAAVTLFLCLVRRRPPCPDEHLRLPLLVLAIAVGAMCVFLWIQYFA
jgi:hypothetical protein